MRKDDRDRERTPRGARHGASSEGIHPAPQDNTMMERIMAQQQEMMQAMMTQQAQLMQLMASHFGRETRGEAIAVAAAPRADVKMQDDECEGSKVLEQINDKKEKEELEGLLTKSKNRFQQRVKTFLKTGEMLERRTKEFELMNEDKTYEKYPFPSKPFNIMPTETELDEVWSVAAESDNTWTIIFPKGTTRRKAITMAHHQMTLLQKGILVESAKQKQETMKVASRLETFKKCVESVVKEFYEARTSSDLDLDRPSKRMPSETWIKAKTEMMYNDVVAHAEKEKAEEDKKKAEERKKKEEAERKLLEVKPELALAQFIDERIAGGQDSSMEEDQEAPGASTVVAALKNSLDAPKNGAGDGGKRLPQSGRGGSWRKPRGPPSPKTRNLGWKKDGKGYVQRAGKAKASVKGNGKGKGKGKQKSSSKGKKGGLGKGKGWWNGGKNGGK